MIFIFLWFKFDNVFRFEWKVLAALQRVGVLERAQLALRMVTKLQPGQV